MDKGRLIYELPLDKKVVAGVIDAIPSNWCWIDGVLESPRELREQGKIAESSILYIERFHSIKPTIRGVTNFDISPGAEGRYTPPNLVDIFANGKYPLRIIFEQAGFQSSPEITIDSAKNIAREFILLGYSGFISVKRAYRHNSPSCTPKTFSIWQEGKQEGRNKNLPPSVELEWDEEGGGKREHLESIVKQLDNLGLKELKL